MRATGFWVGWSLLVWLAFDIAKILLGYFTPLFLCCLKTSLPPNASPLFTILGLSILSLVFSISGLYFGFPKTNIFSCCLNGCILACSPLDGFTLFHTHSYLNIFTLLITNAEVNG